MSGLVHGVIVRHVPPGDLSRVAVDEQPLPHVFVVLGGGGGVLLLVRGPGPCPDADQVPPLPQFFVDVERHLLFFQTKKLKQNKKTKISSAVKVRALLCKKMSGRREIFYRNPCLDIHGLQLDTVFWNFFVSVSILLVCDRLKMSDWSVKYPSLTLLSSEETEIPPKGDAEIPTRVKLSIPKGYYVMITDNKEAHLNCSFLIIFGGG